CTYPLPKNGAIVVAKRKNCMLDEGRGIVKVGGKYFWSVGIGPCFTCEKEAECYPPDVVGACPKCGAPVIIVRLAAKKTRFLSCSNRCGFTAGLPKSGTLTLSKDACEWCEWKMVRVTDKGNKHEFCPNPVHS
ncbi:MAG: topoisomerase DNA-binding C4 zinc finger domain-containing protein, partial [Methanosarcinales archaeon]|nr:topoisomerase DNA-binding C4 zinc finger domain-containing protein [Methanosarcinales archaeon]